MILVLKDMSTPANGNGSADLSKLAQELSTLLNATVSIKPSSPPFQGSPVIVYVATYGERPSKVIIRDFRRDPHLGEKGVEITGDSAGLETQIREAYLSGQP